MHFVEFSPNGKMLFTGSVDGTAKVWDIDMKGGKVEDFDLTDSRMLT